MAKKSENMAEISAKEYAAQITTQLHPHIEFLRDRWQEFCKMVERNAKQLANYQEKHLGQRAQMIKQFDLECEQYKAVIKVANSIESTRLKVLIEKQEAKLQKIQSKMEEEKKMHQEQGWVTWGQSYDTQYLNLLLGPLWGSFYAPCEVVNPLLWILDKEGNRREPTPKESILCDCAILCYVHDHNISGELRIYSPNTYKSKYFACDEFYYLNRHVWPKERLQRAFDAVKAYLDELHEQREPQGKDGQVGDTKQGAPETKPDSTSAQSIHIQNFQGIFGDVQAENVQTGDKSLIYKHTETEKKKKGILRNLWWIITAIVGFLVSLLGILNHLGWLESFKAFFSKLFTH